MNDFTATAMDATGNAASLIKLEDLKKVFYTDEVETHALSGVHVEIAKGEYLSISGPSGCGKSTLLSILGLLDTPTAGRYLLNGTPVENLDNSQRAHIRNKEIGFIFQAFNLIGDLTVYENVELPLTYRAGMGAAERKQRVTEALERVRMAHRRRASLRPSMAWTRSTPVARRSVFSSGTRCAASARVRSSTSSRLC